jgi:hypothetical protein
MWEERTRIRSQLRNGEKKHSSAATREVVDSQVSCFPKRSIKLMFFERTKLLNVYLLDPHKEAQKNHHFSLILTIFFPHDMEHGKTNSERMGFRNGKT